jgi:hypothetical protein
MSYLTPLKVGNQAVCGFNLQKNRGLMGSHALIANNIETKLDSFLSRLAGVKKTQSGWLAFCPGHNDKRSPSLGIKIGNNGGIILKCFAGCSADQIIAAVGLDFTDLYPDKLRPQYHGVAGFDRYKARKEQPRFSRYELFPKVVSEACLLHVAIEEILQGVKPTESDLTRIRQAMDTIWELRAEADR